MSSIYDSLNPVQQEAVRHTEGPLLILAGAGSGKTRVLVYRIAYLIHECGVKPWNIMAITFTNKAAREMRERVDALIGEGAQDVWVSTFHSACARILRRYADRIGYDRNFTIYDTDDQRALVRECVKRLDLDTKLFRERAVLSVISSAKNRMISPEAMADSCRGEAYMMRVARIYAEYQKRLKENNSLDFDDLLLKTVELFTESEEAISYYRERFKYIMVDEYQDTNTVQFRLVSLMAEKYRNLCVVGDDDQSIYAFRGADIRNILEFEGEFPEARVIRLEENYRSTKNILGAANGVIKNNSARRDKTLWTGNEEGEKPVFTVYPTEHDEAVGIVRGIMKMKSPSCRYSDFAVLYRTNAQARVLEEKFILSDIPYRIYGGVNFYQRREIKDLLAYLKTIDSGLDDISVARIVNVPKRGIGSTSLGRAAEYAAEWNLNLYEALKLSDEIPGLGRAASKMKAFTDMIESFRSKADYLSITGLFDHVLESISYIQMLKDEDSDEAQNRIDNIYELRNKIIEYEESDEEPSLSQLLEQIALVADIDEMQEDDDRVALMTLHSAKGLEFPYVFMAGMEEGLFPSYMSINSEDSDVQIEEERRLCYVGITRAMKSLNMSCARKRMHQGNYLVNDISRFIGEVPVEFIDDRTPPGYKESKRQEAESFQSEAVRNRMSRAAYSVERSDRPKKRSVYGKGDLGFVKKGSQIEKEAPDYAAGDRVRHIKFGEGMVTEITETAKDYQVTVDFDKFGVKKMLAGFARLKKL